MAQYPATSVNGCKTYLYSAMLKSRLVTYATGRKFPVEIGTWYGGSSSIIAPSASGMLFCVDTYKESSDELDGNDTYDTFISNMERLGLIDKIVAIRGDAMDPEIIAKLPEQIDFLYVDHEHTYDAVTRLWTLIKPRLKHGCVVLFDDYHRDNWPGVVAAVDEIVASGDLSMIEEIDGTACACLYRGSET